MRRMILLSAILLLTAVWVVAQSEGTSKNESDAPAAQMTLEGCVDGAIGNYALIDPAGASYPLTGKTEQLKNLVGDTVRVTGIVTPVVHVPGAMSEGLETQPTVSVISVKLVSEVCGDTNSIP